MAVAAAVRVGLPVAMPPVQGAVDVHLLPWAPPVPRLAQGLALVAAAAARSPSADVQQVRRSEAGAVRHDPPRPAVSDERGGAMGTLQLRGRRAAVAAASVLGLLGSQPASGLEPKVTAKCAFDLQIGFDRSVPLRRLVIGLYGEEAPVLTRNFYQAFTHSYAKDKEGMVDYRFADVKAVFKDRAIIWADFQFGNYNRKRYTVSKGGVPIDRDETIPLAREDTQTNETNALQHDVPGRVSMRRGGETFDFSVSPVANATWLDETNVVIGQVLEGFDIIEDINKLPVKGGALFEDTLGLLGSLGGDIRADMARENKYKPLKRVRIYNTELVY